MNGWWKIEYTVEPNLDDLGHIAELIQEGYTSGELIGEGEEDEEEEEIEAETVS